MFKLAPASAPVSIEPRPGLKLNFKAPTAPLLAAARGQAATRMAEAGEYGAALGGVVFSLSLAALAFLSWSGVGMEPTDGEPDAEIAGNAERIVALLEQDEASYQAFETGYVLPALAREREKNASSVSANGPGQTAG